MGLAAAPVRFAGRTWGVKESATPVGPGPNLFSAANVEVDGRGLHLRIARTGAGWTCAEVVAQGSFGYGTYAWTVASDVMRLDPHAVLGMFTWSDEVDHANREIDIEFGRLGGPSLSSTGRFTVQAPEPLSSPAFALPSAPRSRHTLTWLPGRVTAASATPGSAPVSWSVTDAVVPRPGGGVAPRINLWLFRGVAPASPQHITVESFAYTPRGGSGAA